MSVLSNHKRHLQLCQIDGQICRRFGFSSPEIQNFVDLIPDELYCEQKREDRHLTKILVVMGYVTTAALQFQKVNDLMCMAI